MKPRLMVLQLMVASFFTLSWGAVGVAHAAPVANRIDVEGGILYVDSANTDVNKFQAITITQAVGGWTLHETGTGPNALPLPAIADGLECQYASGGLDVKTATCVGLGTNGAIVYAGDGNDSVAYVGSGGSVQFGEGGNDTLIGGSGPDELWTQGADALGFSGNMTGGAGPDTYHGGPGQDTVKYSDGRTQGVVVTLADNLPNDGTAPEFENVGSANSIEFVYGSEQADTITGDAGNNLLRGLGGDDHLDGAAGSDQLAGGDGNDVVKGGTGGDRLDGDTPGGAGSPGNDTLNAFDGELDAPLDCGGGNDTLYVDSAAESASNCETRLEGTDPDAPGPSGPSIAPAVDVSPFKAMTVKFPDFVRKTSLCGKKGFCKTADIVMYLARKGINARVSSRTAGSKALNRAAGRSVSPGEVLETSQDGKTIRSGPDDLVKVVAEVFEPSKSRCDPDKPFVVIAGKVVKITKLLEGMGLHDAQQFIEESKCNKRDYEFDYRYVQNTVMPRIAGATVRGTGKDRHFEIVVHHPESRLQFRLTGGAWTYTKGLVPPLYGSGNEIFVPMGKGIEAVGWTAEISTANGIGFEGAHVTLRDQTGQLAGTQDSRTNAKSSVTQRVVPKSGKRYEMYAAVTDREGEAIVGFRSLRARAVEKGRTYFGIDGKRYTLNGSTFGVAKAGVAAHRPKATASALDDDRFTLNSAASRLIQAVKSNPKFDEAQDLELRGASIDQAVAIVNRAIAQGNNEFNNLFESLVQNGVTPVILAGSGSATLRLAQPEVVRGAALLSNGANTVLRDQWVVNVGTGTLALQVGDVTLMPGGAFSVVRSGGSAAGASATPVPLNVGNANFDIDVVRGAPVVGLANQGGLFGPNGGTPVANGIASLIGLDGGTLIGNDGGTLISDKGYGLVNAGGPGLVGNDGGTLIGLDGGTLISENGLGNAGGMNLLAASGVAPG